MGLRSDGGKVPKGTRQDGKTLRTELNVHTTIDLHQRLESMQVADVTFKRIYVLFVSKGLLPPSPCANISFCLFNIVRDINGLAEVNLRKFGQDMLAKLVERYKKID